MVGLSLPLQKTFTTKDGGYDTSLQGEKSYSITNDYAGCDSRTPAFKV
jgi:hypothetical protein